MEKIEIKGGKLTPGGEFIEVSGKAWFKTLPSGSLIMLFTPDSEDKVDKECVK